MFQILLGIMFTWAVSAVLTAAGVFSNDEDNVDYLARSDAKIAIISSSPWVQFTYPGNLLLLYSLLKESPTLSMSLSDSLQSA